MYDSYLLILQINENVPNSFHFLFSKQHITAEKSPNCVRRNARRFNSGERRKQ
jgi:hypothetical protein